MTKLPSGTIIGTQRITWLHEGWELARTVPGACGEPRAISGLPWAPATVPGTVAASLHKDLDAPGRYDADDWWYRMRFAAPEAAAGTRQRLRFEGLATLAEVWLNGSRIAASSNMFVAQRVDVTGLLAADNELAIRFASLDAALAAKRARPRWRTALVEEQN